MNQDKSIQTVDDLLQDDSFLQYCLGSDKEATAAWEVWLRQYPDKKPLAEQAREMLAVLMVEMEDVNANTAVFNRLLDQHMADAAPVVQLPQPASRRRYWWAAAITTGVVVTLAGWLWQKMTADITVQTGLNETRTVHLPDGSDVVLNSNTAIRYPSRFAKNRKVKLEYGEVFLEVVHDEAHPFVITTATGLTIEDIGTAFSVKSIEGLKEDAVQVQEGAVHVTTPTEKAQTIIKDHALRVNKQTGDVTLAMADSMSTSGWLTGQVALYDASLEELGIALHNSFGKEVVFSGPGLKNHRITILFRKTQSLPKLLETLSLLYPLQVQEEDSRILITQR